MSNLYQKAIKHLKRFLRRTYRLFRYHRFPLSIIIALTSLLSIGILAIDISLWLATVISFILFISSVIYYAVYFLHFRKFMDTHNRNHYYFDIFSFRNIILYNIFFVCCFALVGTVLDRWYTSSTQEVLFASKECAIALTSQTYQISYVGMLTYLWQVVVDGGLFGFLGAIGFQPCEIPTGLKISNLLKDSSVKFQSIDLYVSFFIYFTSVVVTVAFWLSILNEILEQIQVQGFEWLHIRSDVTQIFQSPKIDPYELTPLDQKRNQEILRRIAAGKIDIIKFEKKLFHYLSTSGNIGVRDLFLRLMQESDNLTLFRDILIYFQNFYDHRFQGICNKIKIRSVAKANIIEEIESRRVKKK